jgi:hypothetical protein
MHNLTISPAPSSFWGQQGKRDMESRFLFYGSPALQSFFRKLLTFTIRLFQYCRNIRLWYPNANPSEIFPSDAKLGVKKGVLL